MVLLSETLFLKVCRFGITLNSVFREVIPCLISETELLVKDVVLHDKFVCFIRWYLSSTIINLLILRWFPKALAKCWLISKSLVRHLKDFWNFLLIWQGVNWFQGLGKDELISKRFAKDLLWTCCALLEDVVRNFWFKELVGN